MMGDHIAEYEWGVMHRRHLDGTHRAGMTEAEAREWVREAEDLHFVPGTFYVVRRVVGPWEQIDGLVRGDDD